VVVLSMVGWNVVVPFVSQHQLFQICIFSCVFKIGTMLMMFSIYTVVYISLLLYL
jgi:hypothetical protein